MRKIKNNKVLNKSILGESHTWFRQTMKNITTDVYRYMAS